MRISNSRLLPKFEIYNLLRRAFSAFLVVLIGFQLVHCKQRNLNSQINQSVVGTESNAVVFASVGEVNIEAMEDHRKQQILPSSALEMQLSDSENSKPAIASKDKGTKPKVPLWAGFLPLAALLFTGNVAASAKAPEVLSSISAPEKIETVAARDNQSLQVNVGVAGSEIFTKSENGKVTGGIAVDVWRAVRLQVQDEYGFDLQRGDLVPYESIAEGREALERGDIQVLVGGYGKTPERLKKVDFSSKIGQVTTVVVAPKEDKSFFSNAKNFVTNSPSYMLPLVGGLGAVGGILVMLSIPLYKAEKDKGDHFAGRPQAEQFGTAMHVVNMNITTVGQGDKHASTFWGIVYVDTLAFFGSFVFESLKFAAGGSLAALFTASALLGGAQSKTPASYSGKQIAVLRGSDAKEIVSQKVPGAIITEVNSVEEAWQGIESGYFDGFASDDIVVKDWQAKRKNADRMSLRVSGQKNENIAYFDFSDGASVELKEQDIHFMTSAKLSFEYKSKINQAIYAIESNEDLGKIFQNHFIESRSLQPEESSESQ